MTNFMMITFLEPLFFLLSLGLLALIAIYFLFRHSKVKVVSNLFLWTQQIKTVKSGTILRKLPLPLTFFIEFLIITLLILAAVNLMIPKKSLQKNATVILDNSFSMRAKNKEQQKTLNELVLIQLEKLLKEEHNGQKIRILLAGRDTKNLGTFSTVNEALYQLKNNYRCNENIANLNETLALAKKFNIQNNPIYIFTDQKPMQKLSSEVEWHAVGKNIVNTAIINCSRSKINGVDKCMIIIANLSPKSQDTTLTITEKNQKKSEDNDNENYEIFNKQILLAGNALKKITVSLPKNTGQITAKISDDNLKFDNTVTLFPENLQKLTVKVIVENKKISSLINQALLVSEKVVLVNTDPQLIITDNYRNFSLLAHNMLIIDDKTSFKNVKENNATAKSKVDSTIKLLTDKGYSFTAPFTVDRLHQLTLGLNLKNAIWGSRILNNDIVLNKVDREKITSKNKILLKKISDSNPIVMAKQRLLLSTIKDDVSGKENIFMFYDPQKSTLQNTPAFPILFWNLVDWLINKKSGLLQHNYRSGEKIAFKIDSIKNKENFKLIKENDEEVILHKNYTNTYLINANNPGLYTIKNSKKVYQFYVNSLSFNESDLMNGKITKIYKQDKEKQQQVKYYYSLSWILIILALLLMTYHYYLIKQQQEVK